MSVVLLPATALRGYARDASAAFRQTPLEVALGIAAAVAASVAMRHGNEDQSMPRIGATLALALPLLLGLSALRARGVLGAPARWAASLLVLAGAVSYGLWLFDPAHDADAWRTLSLVGAVVMATSLVGAIGVEDREERRLSFWRFNLRLITRIVTVVAYGIALFAALAGAVAAVIALFDLGTPRYLYGDLATAIFFALVPWVIAGGLPELIAPAESGEESAPRLVRLLGSYLYAPVLTVYLAILVAYALKVLATGEAPKNLLSPIILLAGGFGFLGATLLEPLRRDPEHAGVSRLIRLLPVPMLALLPFALWAVWVRRDQYGWTEFRYLRFALLLALAVLAVTGTVRLVRRREPLLLLVPVVLGATLLLTALGPWSATAVSRRSQWARLLEGLESAGLLVAGRVTVRLAPPDADAAPALDVPAEAYERISGSLTYLYDQHGPEAVQELFTTDVSGYRNGRELVSAFGFRAECRAEEQLRFASASLPEGTPVPGLPAGTLYRLQGTRRDTAAAEAPDERAGGPPRVLFVGDAIEVTLADGAGAWTARVDLGPLVDRLNGGVGEGCAVEGSRLSLTLTPEEARLPLVDAAGVTRGELVLTSVNAAAPGDTGVPGARLRLDRIEGLMVVGAR